MRGIGLSKTIYKDMELVDIMNYDTDKNIRLGEAYSFSKPEGTENIVGRGILVCYSGDLNDIMALYGQEPINISITDGVINRMILPNGIAAIQLTSIVRWEDAVNSNYCNFYNNAIDLIHIRKDFDKLADPDLFYNTHLPKECYYSLKSLFHGGVMNAMPGVYSSVKSADLISAHASNIINQTYPLGKYEKCFRPLSALRLMRKVKDIFYIGNVTFKNIRLKSGYVGIIYCAQEVIQAGKNIDLTRTGYLVNAESITIAVTEIYMECIEMCYDFDEAEVAAGESMYWCLEGGKLPDNVREYVHDKFKDKQTKPKGTKEYDSAKLLVNYSYGFLCRTTNDYDHYKSHKLVYPYQWGITTCLYTTLKIVRCMDKVVKAGGKTIAIATDSIKWKGDIDLEYGEELGDLKFEGIYDRAIIKTVYQAVFIKGDEIEVKLAGCLKEKAKEYFTTHSALDIFLPAKIPEGRVMYDYNQETSRVEAIYSDYTMGTFYI